MTTTPSVPVWRQIQKKTFTHWDKLASFLELSDSLHSQILKNSSFPLNLPYRLAEKVQKNTLDDPLLKQFLPHVDESKSALGFVEDPVGDLAARRSAKLLHKYRGRALLTATSACAMHCRYCFRRNFDYDIQDKTFEAELEVLRNDPTISEIILSGGDPLSLSDESLGALLIKLSNIPHIKKIRFHTRFPVGVPERLDSSFLEMLAQIPTQMVFIIHANHPRELDDDVLSALKKVIRLGIPVLNQSVLLKGINDDLETLKELYETMTNHGILPYYIHQLDKVQGASHFEVSEEIGKNLIQELSYHLPGYAVPKYVKEEAGLSSKTLLA